jgi:hypothetical protein
MTVDKPALPSLTPNDFSLAVHPIRASICQLCTGLPMNYAHIALCHRPLARLCLLSYARFALRPQLLTRLSPSFSYTHP